MAMSDKRLRHSQYRGMKMNGRFGVRFGTVQTTLCVVHAHWGTYNSQGRNEIWVLSRGSFASLPQASRLYRGCGWLEEEHANHLASPGAGIAPRHVADRETGGMRSIHCKAFLVVTAFATVGLPLSWSVASSDFDGDGDVDLTDFAAFWTCIHGLGVPASQGCAVDADFDDDGDVDLVDFGSFQASFTGKGVPPALPAKSIGFDLIGIHDPDSDRYDGDCIGCHGSMANEAALDRVTPTAHSRMLMQFGAGNDRCRSCHMGATDFLNGSAANLRKQVNLEDASCAACHGRLGLQPFYAR